MSQILQLHQHLVRKRLNRRGLTSQFHGSPGERMHVYTYRGGSGGVPFVVVHGLGTNAAAYGRLLERMLPHASALWAPELPGHGLSELPDPLPTPKACFQRMAELLDQLVEEPVILVGTSLGGAVALKYALRSPQKVQKLFLVSPAGAPMSEAGFDYVRDVFNMESARDGRDFVRRLFHRSPWYTPVLGSAVKELLNRDIVRLFFDPDSDGDPLKPEDVQSLRPSTMLLWGQSERILPAECLDWYRAHMPENVTIVEPEGYGHSPHLEYPDDLARRLLAFAHGNE